MMLHCSCKYFSFIIFVFSVSQQIALTYKQVAQIDHRQSSWDLAFPIESHNRYEYPSNLRRRLKRAAQIGDDDDYNAENYVEGEASGEYGYYIPGIGYTTDPAQWKRGRPGGGWRPGQGGGGWRPGQGGGSRGPGQGGGGWRPGQGGGGWRPGQGGGGWKPGGSGGRPGKGGGGGKPMNRNNYGTWGKPPKPPAPEPDGPTIVPVGSGSWNNWKPPSGSSGRPGR